MNSQMAPSIVLAIVFVAAVGAVAIRAAARRPEPRAVAGTRPEMARPPAPQGRPAITVERAQYIFTSCTPKGATLFARCATSSTPQDEARMLASCLATCSLCSARSRAARHGRHRSAMTKMNGTKATWPPRQTHHQVCHSPGFLALALRTLGPYRRSTLSAGPLAARFAARAHQ
jgi:hypothetical protein